MEYEIELEEIVGDRQDPVIGKVSVPTGMYSVIVGGEAFVKATGRRLEIAQVHRDSGKPLSFLPVSNRFPLAVREKIAEVVKQKLSEMHSGNDTDRKVVQPPSPESVAAAAAAMERSRANAESLDSQADDENL